MTRLSVTGILLCAALPALAQNTPAPPVLPTTPAAPAAPGVTPEAKSLLEKMFAAYDATKSLTTLTELEVRGGTGTNSVLITGTVDYKFRAPNLVSARALFESKIGGVGTKPESLVVNDGKLLSIADYTSKSYVRQPITDNKTLTNILSRTGGFNFLAQAQLNKAIRSEIVGVQTQSAVVGEPETVDGVVCDRVSIVAAPSNGNTGNVVLLIGKEDSLLRRFDLSGKTPTGDFSIREIYRNVKANADVPDAAFAFEPPAGFKTINPNAQPPVPQPNVPTGTKPAAKQKTAPVKPAPAKPKVPVKKASSDMPSGFRTVADPQTPRFTAPQNPHLKLGSAPPPLSGADLNGKLLNLSQYRGRVVVVDFWATWCKPCVAELPLLTTLYTKYKGKGLEIIGVSLDFDKKPKYLADFLRPRNALWPQIYKPDNGNAALAESYGLETAPLNVVVSRTGKIVAINVHGSELEPAIKAAIAQK